MKNNIIFIILGLLSLPVSLTIGQDKHISYVGPGSRAMDFALTPCKSVIFIPENNIINAYETFSGRQFSSIETPHTDIILSLDISRDSIYLATTAKDGLIIVWDLLEGEIIHSMKIEEKIVQDICFSPDGKYLAAGDSGGNIFLWEFNRDYSLALPHPSEGEITCIAFSPDGRKIFWGNSMGQIWLYDIYNESYSMLPVAHKKWVRDIIISDDGKSLISCGDDGRVVRWEIAGQGGIIINQKKIDISWITSIDLANDRTSTVTGNYKGKIKVLLMSGITYTRNMKSPVIKVRFIINPRGDISLVISTLDYGVALYNLEQFKHN